MKLTLTFCLVACAVVANEAAAPLKTDLFIGCCDASAAVALTDDLFVIADDEDNVLRIYSRDRMGRPASTVDVTAVLDPGKKAPEVDIEASARIGDRIYWISPHGRNAKGKTHEARHRFFATSISVTNGTVQLKAVGNFYAKLLDDLAKDQRLARYGLAKASFFAPKAQGALNIEGMAPTREGHLLIGFRNPIPDGKALLVRLLNPQEIVAGGKPKLG